MEAARTSETSVDNHFTRQYNPEDSSEHFENISNNFQAKKLSPLFQTYNMSPLASISNLIVYKTTKRLPLSKPFGFDANPAFVLSVCSQ
jgi:hypothetical protein